VRIFVKGTLAILTKG